MSPPPGSPHSPSSTDECCQDNTPQSTCFVLLFEQLLHSALYHSCPTNTQKISVWHWKLTLWQALVLERFSFLRQECSFFIFVYPSILLQRRSADPQQTFVTPNWNVLRWNLWTPGRQAPLCCLPMLWEFKDQVSPSNLQIKVTFLSISKIITVAGHKPRTRPQCQWEHQIASGWNYVPSVWNWRVDGTQAVHWLNRHFLSICFLPITNIAQRWYLLLRVWEVVFKAKVVICINPLPQAWVAFLI